MSTLTFSAAGRCGVVGNPSDIYGGSVVSVSIPQRARASLTPQATMEVAIGGDRVVLTRDTDLKAEIAGRWTDIGVAAIRFFADDLSCDGSTPIRRLFGVADADAVRDAFFDNPFLLTAETTIPYRAGLSGSTAIFGALIGCVLDHVGVRLHSHQLAETLKYVEQNLLEVSCGFQDHYMIVFGGLSFLDFREKSGMRQTDEEPFATVEDLSWTIEEPPFVVAHFGGVRDQQGIVHRSIRERWGAGEELAVRNNQRIGELGRLGKKALIGGDLNDLARMMNENHRLQQELGGSFDQIDQFIELARHHGAKAAKLAGGGRGGTLIALHDDREYLAGKLEEAGARFVTFPETGVGLRRENGEGTL